MQKRTVHTLVLHHGPDIELCFMTWLCINHPKLREQFSIDPMAVRIKFIPSGPLRPEDWSGESEINAAALEKKGYCFLDCGGGGAAFDQHGAAENVGQERDLVASLDLLVRETGMLEAEPGFKPFFDLISASDRTGVSLCETSQKDRASRFPHVPRDLRSMVVALNERYPENPEIVLETFMLAMAGTEYLFCELVSAHYELTGDPDGERIADLRAMNFMTVDNAALGLRHALLDRYGALPEADRERAVQADMQRLWAAVEAAWEQREADWRVAEDDLKRAETHRTPYRPRSEGPHRSILICVGYSAAKYFSVVARRKQTDVTIQFYPDGRFMISRKGDEIIFDRVANFLRRIDAHKRGGKLVEPSDPAARNTTSYVLVNGERIPTFYYPSGGFAFGNRFATNPEGLAVSALKPWEVVQVVRRALGA